MTSNTNKQSASAGYTDYTITPYTGAQFDDGTDTSTFDDEYIASLITPLDTAGPDNRMTAPATFDSRGNDTATISTKKEYEGTAPYTAAEKQYLKDGWKDEFHFLRMYALSIYKEEDREEGRAIIRAFMKGEEEEKEELACQASTRDIEQAENRNVGTKTKNSQKTPPGCQETLSFMLGSASLESTYL